MLARLEGQYKNLRIFIEPRNRGKGAALRVGWRRNVRALWRPLRGLTIADYAVRGAVTGDLFGRHFQVGYYAPASASRIVPGNGRLLTNRPLVYSSFRFSYPTGGWTPQSGDPDPGACVTCVKPVPSTLTV